MEQWTRRLVELRTKKIKQNTNLVEICNGKVAVHSRANPVDLGFLTKIKQNHRETTVHQLRDVIICLSNITPVGVSLWALGFVTAGKHPPDAQTAL